MKEHKVVSTIAANYDINTKASKLSSPMSTRKQVFVNIFNDRMPELYSL